MGAPQAAEAFQAFLRRKDDACPDREKGEGAVEGRLQAAEQGQVLPESQDMGPDRRIVPSEDLRVGSSGTGLIAFIL